VNSVARYGDEIDNRRTARLARNAMRRTAAKRGGVHHHKLVLRMSELMLFGVGLLRSPNVRAVLE